MSSHKAVADVETLVGNRKIAQMDVIYLKMFYLTIVFF